MFNYFLSNLFVIIFYTLTQGLLLPQIHPFHCTSGSRGIYLFFTDTVCTKYISTNTIHAQQHWKLKVLMNV